MLTAKVLARSEADRKSVDILKRQRSLHVDLSRGS